MKNKTAWVSLAAAFLVGISSISWADDDTNDYINSRSYFGVLGTTTTIDQWGDFDGTHSVQYGPTTFQTSPVTAFTNPEVDIIPAIDRNFGFGALVGHREGPWAAEFSYWRSDHTASYTGGSSVTFTTPARLEAFNIDFKRYFLTELPIQPFVSVGLTFPWLWMHNTSQILDYHNPPGPNGYDVIAINDETISGLGINLGGGVEMYLSDLFSITGGAYGRFVGFDQINGASKISLNSIYFDNNPADKGSLAGNSLNIFIATTVAIK